jgi:hypothetical protein
VEALPVLVHELEEDVGTPTVPSSVCLEVTDRCFLPYAFPDIDVCAVLPQAQRQKIQLTMH